MSEPKRWSEDGAPRDILLLMRAARAERPSEASLHRSLAALGAGLAALSAASVGAAGTAASAGTVANAAPSITASVVAKWAVLGAALGTLTVGTATIAPRVLERAPSRAPSSQPPTVVTTRAVESVPSATAPDPNPTASTSSTAPHAAREARAAPPGASVPLGDETLMDEVRSVDRARAALAAGRAAAALALLDEYDRRFPEQRFGPEALYLRIEAFVSLGSIARARITAERLLSRYPNSPQGERARAVLVRNP